MKKWYTSKTLYANVLGAAALYFGWLTPEVTGAILVLVNTILRLITKEAIEW